jgi:hypothetical protein
MNGPRELLSTGGDSENRNFFGDQKQPILQDCLQPTDMWSGLAGLEAKGAEIRQLVRGPSAERPPSAVRRTPGQGVSRSAARFAA